MSIELPNNKISRTLPEQVGFNSRKIEEIIKAINDFELVDKVIDLNSASGVLTDTQFGIAELSPSFVLYSGKVFVKAYEDGTNIDFIEVGALIGGSTTLTLSVERFRVTVATKAYQYAVVQLFETYSKTQIDSVVSTINSSIASKASLSGANFTGDLGPLQNIVDSSNRKRFIEGNITMESISGVTQTYAKWSLSGTHLMVVLAFKIDNGSVINSTIAAINVPQWVKDKIVPTYGTAALRSNEAVFAADGSTTQTALTVLGKTSNTVYIAIYGFTATADRYARMQFDLLIDTE